MTKEDSAFGPGMMFGIPGPGPKPDRKPIPSDPKKKKGKYLKTMKTHIPTYEQFDEELNESYASLLKSVATVLLSDPRVRSSAIELANSIIGKGIEQAFSHADKKLGISGYETPERDDVDFESDTIETQDDANEFVSSYMAASVAKTESIPKSKFSTTVQTIKDYIKSIFE